MGRVGFARFSRGRTECGVDYLAVVWAPPSSGLLPFLLLLLGVRGGSQEFVHTVLLLRWTSSLKKRKSLGLPISIQWLMSTPMTSQKAQAQRPLTCWISVFFSSAGQVTTRSRHFETLWAPPRSRGSSRWQPKKKNYYILYYTTTSHSNHIVLAYIVLYYRRIMFMRGVKQGSPLYYCWI